MVREKAYRGMTNTKKTPIFKSIRITERFVNFLDENKIKKFIKIVKKYNSTRVEE